MKSRAPQGTKTKQGKKEMLRLLLILLYAATIIGCTEDTSEGPSTEDKGLQPGKAMSNEELEKIYQELERESDKWEESGLGIPGPGFSRCVAKLAKAVPNNRPFFREQLRSERHSILSILWCSPLREKHKSELRRRSPEERREIWLRILAEDPKSDEQEK